MKGLPFAIGAVLVSATLTLPSAAIAKGSGSGKGSGGQNGSHNHGSHNHGSHHNGHGHGATHFHHRDYHGWTRYCWFPRYRCYGYYSPDDGEWYYWNGPSNRFLPVSEMASNPPDDSVNAAPSLPPGATAVSYVAGNQE